jgi:tetratricopeptide (TPR) repeat protein
MSPEQARGEEIDVRSDLFSFGIVLYQVATGRRPFQKTTAVATVDAILHHTPDAPRSLNPDLPDELDALICKALEKDPGARYQGASEMLAELKLLQSGNTPEWHSGPRPTKSNSTSLLRIPWARIVSVLVVALGLSVGGYLYFHHTSRLTDKDTIVLADFTNTTGDPVFDGTLRQGISVQLQQSPFLSLISEERIQQMLRLMGQPPDARLNPQIAREICERTGSAAVLDGSIASLGSQYVLGLRAINCRTGDVLDQEQSQAARKEDVLTALSQIASKFRNRVGESLTTIGKHDTPLAEATTPSLEALKAYSTGWKVLSSTGPSAALPFFKRAAEIDPQFAMAYAFQGRLYGDIGEFGLSAESTSKAYQLRDRASDDEKFFISASYDMQVTGDLDKAQQTCEAWAQTYPRDLIPHAFLSGIIYPVTGKYEKALEEASKAIDIDPDFAIGYGVLTFSYEYLDRVQEAGDALQWAATRKLENPDFFTQRYDIAFLKGDRAEMDRAAKQAHTDPDAEAVISHHQAFVLAYSGQLEKAKKMSRRAADLARAASQRDRVAQFEAGPALWEAFFGNAAAAKQAATPVLELSKDREAEYGAAFALALAGDSSHSATLANDLEKRFPEDTSVKFSYLPTLRAQLTLNHGEPSKAIDLLQIAAPNELGAPRSSFFGFFGALYPVYVRGQAYLAAHRATEAATEFQKILDHRGVVVSDPIGALAHLQIGRAYALQGDTAKAKAAYQDFLALWKDADPELPVLQQARREYANLQ